MTSQSDAAEISRLLETMEHAYGLLWRSVGADQKYIHEARQVLMKALGKAGQYAGISWVTEKHGAMTSDELLRTMEPRTDTDRNLRASLAWAVNAAEIALSNKNTAPSNPVEFRKECEQLATAKRLLESE